MRTLPLLLLALLLGACASEPAPATEDAPAVSPEEAVIPEHALGVLADPGALTGMIGPEVVETGAGACYRYEDAVIIDRTGGDESGYLLVRPESSDCEGPAQDGDRQFETQPFEFFLGYADGYLFIDSGTGPDGRTLEVTEVESGRTIYEGDYIHEVNRAEKGLYFLWIPTDLAPEAPCERAEEWEAAYMTVGFEEQYALDAGSGALMPLGAMTCSMRQ